MKSLLIAVVLVALAGCAGLRTAWVLQMEYITPVEKPAVVVPEKKPGA